MQWNSPEVVRNLLCFIANSSYCYVICSFFQKLFTQVGNSRHAARRALQSVPVRCSCWNNFAQSACFAGSICDPYRVQENSHEVTRFGSFRKAIRTSWDSPNAKRHALHSVRVKSSSGNCYGLVPRSGPMHVAWCGPIATTRLRWHSRAISAGRHVDQGQSRHPCRPQAPP